jgi:cysteine desulfurase/selenocysteine lyase
MDLAALRRDFPLLTRTIDGEPITYLDSASTTPKPQSVIDAVVRFYTHHTANVHRGVHVLSEEATAEFEEARAEVAGFLGCSPAEIVFTKNATMSMNMVAHGLDFAPDDEVLLTALEHHANFMPWRLHAKAVTVDLAEDGLPRYEQIRERLTPKTRLVTLAHVSNTTGHIAPIEDWIAEARKVGALTLVDAAQSASHLPIDVRRIGCDFLAFSGHKLLGPSGVGVLYARRELLEKMRPLEVGGGMVAYHARDRYELKEAPFKFEAGTPNMEGVLGLGAAIRYLRRIGMDRIAKHSQDLGAQMLEALQAIPGIQVLGRSAPRSRRIALCTFHVNAGGMGQSDVARYLCDANQILVSGGYHCAHILHHELKLEGTVRASAHLFNTPDEIDKLARAVREIAI